MGREAKFKYGLAKDKRMAQLHLEHKWTPEEAKLAEHLVGTLSKHSLPSSLDAPGASRPGRSDVADLFPFFLLSFLPTRLDSIDMPSTFRLHREMYLKTLREQTTDEQKELFTYPSERFEMIGWYVLFPPESPSRFLRD